MRECVPPDREVRAYRRFCSAPGPGARHSESRPGLFRRDHRRTRLQLRTDAEGASCHFDGTGAIVLQMLEQLRIDVAFLEFRTAENLPMQRNRSLDSFHNEH